MSATRKMWLQRLKALTESDVPQITGKIIGAILFIPLFIPRKVFGSIWEFVSDLDSELVAFILMLSMVACFAVGGGYAIYQSERTLDATEIATVTKTNSCAKIAVDEYFVQNPHGLMRNSVMSSIVDKCEPIMLRAEYERMMSGESKAK